LYIISKNYTFSTYSTNKEYAVHVNKKRWIANALMLIPNCINPYASEFENILLQEKSWVKVELFVESILYHQLLSPLTFLNL